MQMHLYQLTCRGSGHLQRCEALWREAQALGYHLKLNTVVASPNVHDDMSEVVLRLRPDRWKVFKVLPVAGQNDGALHTGAPSSHPGSCSDAGSYCSATTFTPDAC
eukprot:jgi/Ulvmu1/7431/UM036_0092.1